VKRWSQLTSTQQRLIIGAAVAETALKAAMLADLRKRPADGIRGRKWLWASSTLLNSAGIIPVAYFVIGRKR
jgi:hypothetical protein